MGKVFFCVLSFLLGSVYATAAYHGKHVIIAVDQTPDVVGKSYMNSLYSSLVALLKGEDPMQGLNPAESYVRGDFKINPGDRISLFGFGIPGGETGTGRLQEMSLRGNFDSRELAQELFNNLIYPIYEGNIDDIDSFVNTTLKDACMGNTPRARSIADNTKNAVTLSHYVFPKIFDYVKFDEPAQEYNYIVLSNFKSGTTSQNTSDDKAVLRNIFQKEGPVNMVLTLSNEKSKPFYTVDLFLLAKGNNTDDLLVLGKKIDLTQQLGTSVYIKSNLSMDQKSLGSNKFDIGPVDIEFVKDKTLTIDSVQLEITDGNGKTVYSGFPSGGRYNEAAREYRLPSWTLDSPISLSPGYTLKFKYIFYATPETASGEKLMPFAYVADREMLLTSDNFVTNSDTMIFITIFSILAILAIVGFVLWKIRERRGKKALKGFKFNIWPISNTRFMDVSDNKVENYDCWYFRPGDREKRIQVTGKVDVKYPSFARQYKIVAEMEVQDIDFNDDFSFRPEGNAPDGTLKVANRWYSITLEPDGRFDTSVVAYMERDVNSPDYNRDDHNVLRLQVKVRVRFVDKNGKTVVELPALLKKYAFIVRPEIMNSDLWMAFDPGTSGSCVAYGYGGLPDQTNNIHLAYNKTTDTSRRETVSPIFYSKIQILPRGGFFKGVPAEELQVFDFEKRTGDYFFGNAAHIYWGRNSFQSIKKLLGYSNELEVEGANGTIRKIKGEELAHLLVKGLCHEFRQFIITDEDVNPEVRQRFIGADDSLTPSRAIVAVPNNYTVKKVQAMVDTVKKTGLFKEVHYIYEAEGVMMYYFNHNWANLPKLENKTFVVFDMGGATINATAFRIKVYTDRSASGAIFTRSIEVDTISRVGYTVGGDNIDFALIKVLYGMPSMKTALSDIGMSETEHSRRNKKNIISFVQKLKLDYILATRGEFTTDNWAANPDVFWTNLFAEAKNWGLSLPASMTDEDLAYFANESKSQQSNMKKLVIESITDAIDELLHDVEKSDIELILSGRSVLYPGIGETVVDAVKKRADSVSEWNYGGSRETRDEAVKTAVVRGACWYAMFSRFVALRHDKLTSTFGYMDMENNKSKFRPVLTKNMPFDEDGSLEAEVTPLYPLINNIAFVQMLGRSFDEIYDNEIFHKMNDLEQITSAQLTGHVRSVKIRVDYNNNFTYEVRVAGETTPIKGACSAADTDITDRNSEAYSFAALASLDDNKATPEQLAQEQALVGRATGSVGGSKQSGTRHEQKTYSNFKKKRF